MKTLRLFLAMAVVLVCAPRAWSQATPTWVTGPFGVCSVTCGGGIASRTVTCMQNGVPVSSSLCDPAVPVATQQCNTAACPVDCVLSPFGPFSACSMSCGGGVQQRTRTILTPPSGGGAACGALTQTQSCNIQQCPIDCQWSQWSDFSACSTTACGTAGVETRTRSVLVQAQFGGAACVGSAIETAQCAPVACPVDCQWGDWVSVGTCSAAACGQTGTIIQTRIPAVQAQNGGAACVGPATQTIACQAQACQPPQTIIPRVDCAGPDPYNPSRSIAVFGYENQTGGGLSMASTFAVNGVPATDAGLPASFLAGLQVGAFAYRYDPLNDTPAWTINGLSASPSALTPQCAGMPGAQGLQGERGLQGAPGETGQQGLQGVPGNPGSQGLQGVQGVPGTPGAAGATGATGATGMTGATGPQGIQGPIGPMGPIGSAGPAGKDAQSPSGTVLYVVHGAPAPSGYTLIGFFEQDLKVGNDHNDRDHDRDGSRHLSLRIDVYRKN